MFKQHPIIVIFGALITQMTSRMELHVIVNVRAGNGKSKIIWQQLKQQLKTPFQEYMTEFPGHGTELAKTIVQQCNTKTLILVVGGDGTIHEVINGTIQSEHVAVGFIPAGSGNDFARCFNSFKTAEEIDQYVQSVGAIQKMDCGMIEIGDSKVFVNNAGIGFDAYVVKQANQSNIKKRLNKIGLGKLSYVYFLIISIFSFRCFNLEIEHNGNIKKFEHVWFATISNQPYFGGGMNISPKSIPNDGRLELTVVHNLAKWKLLLLFVTVFFGKHTGLKEVDQMSADQFTLRVSEISFCHTDGELIDYTDSTKPIQFSVMPNSWNLVKN